jgi:hypothetical protein
VTGFGRGPSEVDDTGALTAFLALPVERVARFALPVFFAPTIGRKASYLLKGREIGKPAGKDGRSRRGLATLARGAQGLYASFLAEPADEEEKARPSPEGLATVREFPRGFREAS